MSDRSPLDRLCGPDGPLVPEPGDANEFAGLLRSGEARLVDSERADLSLDSRFDLAYNAAHALCLAALRHAGYRTRRRYVVFQVLPHTLGLGPEVWRVLHDAHVSRNVSEYEGDLSLDDRMLDGLIDCTRRVLSQVKALPSL